MISVSPNVLFISGWLRSAFAAALTTRSVYVGRTFCDSHSAISCVRSLTASSMFTSMSIVSCAELRRLSCMRVAMVLRMPFTGIALTAGGAAEAVRCADRLGVADGFAAARSTSSFVMRPPGPVPVTRARSTPSSAREPFCERRRWRPAAARAGAAHGCRGRAHVGFDDAAAGAGAAHRCDVDAHFTGEPPCGGRREHAPPAALGGAARRGRRRCALPWRRGAAAGADERR